MGLEAGLYISELDPNNPLGGDPKSEGDDHIRLTKRATQNSFGAFVGTTATPKSVTLTEDQINDAALKSATATISGAWTWSVDLILADGVAISSSSQDLVKRSGGESIIGNDAQRCQVRGIDTVDLYAGAALSARAFPAAGGGFQLLDRNISSRLAGFRNPRLQNIAPGDAFTQDLEGTVQRSNVAAGVDIDIPTLEQGTSIRYAHTTTGTQSLAADGVTIELFDGADATITSVALVPGSAVELYWAAPTLVYIFGTNGVTGVA